MPNSVTLIKVHSKFPMKFVDKSCSPFLSFQSLDLTILSSHKNLSNILYLVMKILTEKKTVNYLGITHFLVAGIFYFSFPNILKIKDKILLIFSVQFQNVRFNSILKKVQFSSIQQNIKKGQKTDLDIFHMVTMGL